ncbi:MAG: hypothetical protein HFJ12_01275 [Bacilli bacterium]|nr:hypothetical protein [Bacilli bacterium]
MAPKTGKNKKTIQIELDKDRLIKNTFIILVVIVICLICFFASSSRSKPYEKSSSQEASSEGNNVLEQATKQAGEISDDKRVQPEEISLKTYLELYDKEGESLVLISRPTCQYCKIATPIIENIIYEKNVKIHYLNSDNLTEEENSTLISSDNYFSSGYGTPLLLVVGNHKIKDQVEGLVTKESYEAFFQEYGFME